MNSTGTPRPDADVQQREYAVVNGYVVTQATYCTCGTGGETPHEPGCGLEPVGPVDEVIADAVAILKAAGATVWTETRTGFNCTLGEPQPMLHTYIQLPPKEIDDDDRP